MPYRPPAPYGGYDQRERNIVELIREQGRINAESARSQGDIWGNAVRDVGNIVAGGVQQHQQDQAAKKEAERLSAQDNAFVERMSSGQPMMPVDFLRIYGPDRGMKMAQGWGQLQQPKPDIKLVAAGFDAQSDPMKAQTYPQVRAKLTAAQPELAEVMPEAYDPEWWGSMRTQMGIGGARGPQLRDVAPGHSVIDERTGEVKFTAPNGEKPDARSLDIQAAEALQRGDQATYDRLVRVKREMGRADDAPRTAPTLTPTAESNVINRLSAQWTKAVKPIADLSDQVTRMEAGLSAARAGDLNAGSQAVITTFNKILDPTSVVRESEYDRSAAGQSLLNRAKGAFEKLRSGGAGMPLEELETYAALARELAETQAQGRLNSTRSRLQKTAKHYNIPEELILEETPSLGGGQAPSAAAPPSAANVRPPARRPTPAAGATRKVNGQTLKWDGKGWYTED
jgi:hypothetical protein